MRLVPLILLGLLVAACNQGPEVDLKNVTPAEVAKAMNESGATRAMIEPGQWSSTVQVLEMDTSSLPPEMAATIRAETGKPRTVEACLTADQVDHPERMLGQVPPGCRYDHYRMGGGKIDGKMRCPTPIGDQTMAIAGTYGKDRYSLTIDNRGPKAPDAAPGKPVAGVMNSKMKLDARRLGDCAAAPK